MTPRAEHSEYHDRPPLLHDFPYHLQVNSLESEDGSSESSGSN